ncbi:MAG: hypothetical protein J5733_06220, partial [Bacteroidaceae bacterium]|nr:hypothetical protein [Bacteroidaceae bacterium]
LKALKENNLRELKDSIKENSIGDNGKITHYPALQDAVNDLHSIGKDIETSYEKYNQLEDEVNKYIEAVKRIKFFSDVANALLKQCYWLDENILEKNDLPDNRKAKLDELKESLKDIKGKQSVETSRQLAKECATMYKTLIDDWLLHIKESVAGAQAALKSLKEVEEHRNLKNALEEAKGFLASIEEVRRLRPDYLKENDFSGILKKEQESLKKLADEKISFEGMLRAVQKQNEFAQLDNELRPLRDRMNDAERDGVSKANDAQKHFDAGHYKEAAEDWKKAVEAYEAFERRNKGDIDNLRKNVKASIQKVRECLVKTQGIALETGDEAKINDARKQCDAAEGLLGRNEQTVEELANTGENLKKDEERLHGILAAAQARARRQEFEKLDEELQLYRNEMTAAEKDGIAKAAGAQKAFEAGRFEDAERLWGDAIRAYRDFDERTRPTLAEVEKLMETIGISLGDFTKLPISKEDRETFGKWFDDARNDVEKNNLRLARRKLTETFEKMQIPWTEGWEKCCRERAVKVNVAQVVIPEDVKMGIDEARQAAKSAFDEKNYELARKSWKMACDEYERLLGPEPTLDEVAVLEKDVKGLLDTVGELPVDFEVEKAKGLSFDVASAAYKKGLADFHKQELRPARRFFQDAQGQLNELKDIREKQKERLDNYITQARTAFDMSNAVQLSKLIGDIEAIDRNHEELVVLKEKGKALQAFLNAREANENEKYDELKGALDGLNKGYLDRHKDEIELLEKIWTAYKDLKPVQKTFNTDTLEKAAAMLGIKPGSKMAQDIRDNCFETIWQNAKKASDEGKYDLFKGYLDTLNEYHYTGNQDERKTLTSLMEAEREKNFSEDTLENVDKMLALKRDSKLAERLRRKCLDEIWKKANEANKNEEYRYNNNLALYLNKLETYGYKEPERGKMDELRKICKAADELKSALREKDNSARLDKAVDLLNLKKGISAWAAGIREDCLGDMFRRAQEAENKEDYVRLKNVLDVLNKYRFDEKRMNNLLKIQKAYDDMMNENKVMTTAMNEGKDGVREAKSTLKEAEKLIALRNGHSEKANGVRVVCWLAILNPLFENARRMDKENKDYKTTWQGLKKQVKEYLDALNGPDPKLQEKMDECDKKLNDVIVPPPPPAPQPQPQPQPIALDKRVVLGNGVEIKLVKLKVSENSSENLWVAEGRMTGSQYAALLNSVQWRLTKEEKDVFKQLYGENVKAKDSFTWDEAWNWCNLLNRVSSESVPAGCQFRLPTKSEWEACRKQSWKFGMRTDMGEWCLDAVVDKQQPIQFPAPRGYVVSLGKDGGKRETKSVIRVVMMGDGKQLGSRAEYFLRIKGTRENPNEVLKFVDGSDRVKLSTFKSAPVTFRVVLGPVVPFK